MFNKIYKLILCLLVFGYSIYQFFLDNIGNGIALIFLSLIFLLLYFKNEILIMAFLKMRKQDFDGTENWLNKMTEPTPAEMDAQLAANIELQKNPIEETLPLPWVS